jgi:hypothetical protein
MDNLSGCQTNFRQLKMPTKKIGMFGDRLHHFPRYGSTGATNVWQHYRLAYSHNQVGVIESYA